MTDPGSILLALLVAPLAVGALLGVVVGLRRSVVALVVLTVGLLAVSTNVPALNPADVLLSALLTSVGAWVGSRRTHTHVGAALVSVALFLTVAEVASRFSTQPVPGEPSPVALNLEIMSSFCAFSATRQPRPPPADGHFVLHLGDSILAWAPADVPTAVARLDAEDVHAHVNAGIVGTGPDCAWMVHRDAPRADLVVLHLFAVNELGDLDAGYAWCDAKPLFDYATTPPVPRCPDGPGAPLTIDGRLMATPAPWVLRWARAHSALAVAITDAWEVARWTHAHPGLDGSPDRVARQLAKLEAVLGMIRDDVRARGGTFVVSLVPIRPVLADDAVTAQLASLRAILERLAIPWVDASRLLADAEAAGVSPDALYTNGMPNDPHLADESHRRYAAWLAANLAPWLRDVPVRAP